jgi:antitoxin PrlF
MQFTDLENMGAGYNSGVAFWQVINKLSAWNSNVVQSHLSECRFKWHEVLVYVILVLFLLKREITMLITSKGQITIPKEFREALGLLPHTDVEFELIGDELRVRKAKQSVRGKKLLEAMAGKSTVSMSTDEIMQLTRED